MPPSPDKKYFLLDSCIVEYWLNEYMQPSITNQLSSWAGSVFDLAISEISYAELIGGALRDKVKRVKEQLNQYTRFEVTQRVLTGSGILATVYNHKSKSSGASLQDRVIAATSFVYNLPVVTADVNDYPHPFFTSHQSANLLYTKKKKVHLITIDILKPNIDALNHWYSKIG